MSGSDFIIPRLGSLIYVIIFSGIMGKSKFGLKENMIILDIMETWGQELLEFLEKNKSTIFGYIDDAFNIDKQAEEDVMIRINRPDNQFQTDWDNILIESEKIVGNSALIGFHCTRLTELEITSIKQDGLDILNKNLFHKRIKKLKESNLISGHIFDELLIKNNVDDSNRRGFLWFCHCISTLNDESGLYRLFRRWGGESLYWQHEGDSLCNKILQKIGIPCIVLGLLSPSNIHEIKPLNERMVRHWRDSFKIDSASQDTDTSVKKNIQVFKVISIHDSLFSDLTGYTQWSKEIY